jgi:hypothetical protein
MPGDFCLQTTKSSALKNHDVILYFFGPGSAENKSE